MKIVLITSLIASDVAGGMVQYTSQFANSLPENVDTFVISHPNVCRAYFNKCITVVTVKPPTKYYSPRILSFHEIVKAVNKIAPDIIHIQVHHPWLCFALPFLRKYPLVVTIHDPKPHEGEKKIIWEMAKKLLMHSADRVIVHGEHLRKLTISRRIRPDKIEVIPHGDYSFFTMFGRGDITEQKNSILFFGRIRAYKGLDYLLKASAKVIAEIPDAKFIIAGRGDFEKYSGLINERYRANFEIHNKYIADEQVAELFQRSAVVCLPYTDASQSGVVNIAYAFKKPVIVTNVGSIPEIVDNGKTGLVIEPKDSSAIANAIIALLKNDDLRMNLGENGLRKQREELSWDKIAKKTIEVYQDILDQKSWCKC